MSGHKKYLSVALLSAVLLPAMASAADAPATFTAEQEAQIGKIAADYWSPTRKFSCRQARNCSKFRLSSRPARPPVRC